MLFIVTHISPYFKLINYTSGKEDMTEPSSRWQIVHTDPIIIRMNTQRKK